MRCLLLLASLLASTPVVAVYDWKVHDPNRLWQQECSACHLAYMAKWLSADNWRQIMQGLDRHFGANASVDSRAREEISAYLVGQAGPERDASNSSPTLRITDTPWFLRGHGPGAQRLWANREAGRAAECTACHHGPVLPD